MASTGQKWAIGCGIGCLLVVIILGGVGTCGYFGLRELKESAEELEVQQDELRDRFGSLDTFTPAADGTIAPAALETFLTVRDSLLARSEDMAAIIATLDGEAGKLEKIRAGMKLIPHLVQYIGLRAAVLLEQDMHPGQYTYIYALAYYSWLGHDPGDGPDFQLDSDDDNNGIRWSDDSHGDDAHADRARRARRALNDLMLGWLGSQLEAETTAGREESEWAANLRAELDALRADPERLAWESALPEPLERSLTPYREALDHRYAELLNALEVSLLSDDCPTSRSPDHPAGAPLSPGAVELRAPPRRPSARTAPSLTAGALPGARRSGSISPAPGI